ncbi:MAG: vitamin B12 dependent-methionine synthase activation domain-containing protein [Pseudomonadota bacterium]
MQPSQDVTRVTMTQQRSAVDSTNPVPVPPFWGTRCLENIPLRAILPYINRTTLYKFQWGFKPQGRDINEYKVYAKKELDPILNRLVLASDQNNILQPKALYGYFSCQSEGDSLVVYTSPESNEEACRFELPRQRTERKLCVADFFRSKESGQRDVIVMMLVTIGQHAADYARDLFHKNEYQEYLYWHGLNAEGAEGLAEYVHKRIRTELGFGSEDARQLDELIKQHYRGSRYSFGYPACPNLGDQRKILQLLEADRIGVVMGEEDQLWPEDSTSALISHHPAAKYFSVY